MQKVIISAIGGAVIGAVATGAIFANAQPAPPPPGVAAPAPDRPQWMGRMHRDGDGDRMQGRRWGMLRTFALVYRQEDRQLSPADVQKIAEAFLLWHGNHTWKVTDVAPTSDGVIGFSIATPEGSVIARFTMDPHSARVIRTG